MSDIKLTREQGLLILRGISAIEGFLMSLDKNTGYKDVLEVHALPTIDMLFDLLSAGKDQPL